MSSYCVPFFPTKCRGSLHIVIRACLVEKHEAVAHAEYLRADVW